MFLIQHQLDRACVNGDTFVTVTLIRDHQADMVARVAEYAEGNHWHVVTVWRGEANITYMLLKHRPE